MVVTYRDQQVSSPLIQIVVRDSRLADWSAKIETAASKTRQ
jgi:hypothetical protein